MGLSSRLYFFFNWNKVEMDLLSFQVQPKHLGCVGLSCFYLAVKSTEEERNVPLATDLIRISQYRFTVSDLMRMEKIVLEKVCWKVKATTAFQFLQLYYSLLQENVPHERYVSFVFNKGDVETRILSECYIKSVCWENFNQVKWQLSHFSLHFTLQQKWGDIQSKVASWSLWILKMVNSLTLHFPFIG